ncbi:hypothetical protein HOLleu_19740 [Holothuria leucospilota]|uniref:Uncharacterized protein n=1 Tax=Holothuria leucospilota TaxID=206669 RepID=A0A9Q1C049_HOLLE|nr:hypothetical protein HOLleu_19740 [Holothuria leucospilota]
MFMLNSLKGTMHYKTNIRVCWKYTLNSKGVKEVLLHWYKQNKTKFYNHFCVSTSYICTYL